MAIQGVGNSQNYFASENVPKRAAESTPQPKTETTVISTDRVDSDIASLKSKGLALASSINRYDDEDTRLHLEQQLTQIQNELRQKDNDIYRRQNSQAITLGVDVEA